MLEDNGIKVLYLGGGKYSSKNIGRIVGLLHQEESHIAHLHGYRATNFGRMATRRIGAINIVHEHAALGLVPHQYVADWMLRNYTDAAIAVSESVKDFMVRVRHIPPPKIQVIGNGIPISCYSKMETAACFKKRCELGIPDGVRVVGTVTRLRQEKGVRYFIKAMPPILKEFPNVLFLIVGEGPLRSRLELMTRELGIANHVRFLGFRSDITEILSILDVNVIPSLTEGFPLSLVEGMSVGNAIVASQVGGMAEIAQHGRELLFVRPTDWQDIAAKVLFLLRNLMIAKKLSHEAMQAREKFKVETSASQIATLYVDLVASQMNSQ
jgi:glycosyltransferase involved in cell wall biosynthesis